MDRRLLTLAALLGPALFLLARGLSSAMSPLAAGANALLLYWIVLAAALWRWADPDRLRQVAPLRRPGALVTAALALPVIVVAVTTMRLLGTTILPAHVLLACGLMALLHGFLEEMFWRGALLPGTDPAPRDAAVSLGLFTWTHLGWLGAAGLDLGASPAPFLLATLALGGAWTASRLLSGTLGAAIMSHAALALFLFTGIAARGWG